MSISAILLVQHSLAIASIQLRWISHSSTPLPRDFDLVVPQIANLSSIQLRKGITLIATLDAARINPILSATLSPSNGGHPNVVTVTWQARSLQAHSYNYAPLQP